MKRTVEILAPAGSLESMQASFKAGADAVYIGGKSFGARAYADNPDSDKLLEAIDYAHLRGKRLYLTVNTLVKQNELGQLYEYLRPLYLHGLDAAIVQDLGVLNLLSRCFPDLPVHISTQMSITTAEAVNLFGKNVARIVPARELSIHEITELKNRTGLELEVFVHGALCYCYSGQCLFSSACGDRSGNRGRCAQPCRKPYEVFGKKNCYILSPKDICTLDRIPDLIEAGVDSFKIEGRMKSSHYACGVTDIYRKAADLYYDRGREGYYRFISENKDAWEEKKTVLLDLFNRGGFSEGYAFSETGTGMMSVKRPNHDGVYVGKATVKNCFAELKLVQNLYAGDVLEIREACENNYSVKGSEGAYGGRDGALGKEKRYSYTTPVEHCKGDIIRFKAFEKPLKKAGGKSEEKTVGVYRIRRERLLNDLTEKYIDAEDCITVNGSVRLLAGEPIAFKAETCSENRITGKKYFAEAFGAKANEAVNAPLDIKTVQEKLKRSGGSPFKFEKLDAKITGKVFVQKSALGNIRREALESLEKAICEDFRRSSADCAEHYETVRIGKNVIDASVQNVHAVPEKTYAPGISCAVFTKEQMEVCAKNNLVGQVVLDMSAPVCEWLLQNKEKAIEQLEKTGKKIFLRTARIADEKNLEILKKFLHEMFMPEKSVCEDCSGGSGQNGSKTKGGIVKGFFVRNLSAAAIISNYAKTTGAEIALIADKNIYAVNEEACVFLLNNGFSGFISPSETSLLEGMELKKAAEDIGLLRGLCVYGREELMISRQCVKKSLNRCGKKQEWVEIKSFEGKKYPVYTDCSECRNRIFDSAPLDLRFRKEVSDKLCPDIVLFEFTDENGERTEKTLNEFEKYYGGKNEKTVNNCENKLVFGHFDRPVM